MTDFQKNPFLISPKNISFEAISAFWIEHLWPGRISPIEPVSCINSAGEIDILLQGKYEPQFFGIYFEEALCGVLSICQTSFTEVRLRGICVRPEMRGKGFSNLLLKKAFEQISMIPNIQVVWTMSRESNFNFYNKFNFQKFKFVTQYEYGPHIILKNSEILKTETQLKAQFEGHLVEDES